MIGLRALPHVCVPSFLALDQHRLIRSFHLDLQSQSLRALPKACLSDISFHDKQVS
ncbi:hypothetical protein SynROS8604_01311 [Synechococcus sp. ROS8604]|nr:hypothetical protein SynROS8604_01311 [Synechococcus sp. ROS8604]